MKQETDLTEPQNDVVPGRVGAPQASPGANKESRMTVDPIHDLDAADDESTVRRIKDLPREFGVMLVSIGALGVVLPGMMGAPALVAGGLVLWPGTFGGLEEWIRRRNPDLYHRGMQQLGRFLDDLERRYPQSSSRPRQDG
jgi:hypothetical protein